MSRSIGDVYLKRHEFSCIYQKFGSSIPLKRAVITAEPSISVRKLNVLDQFVIFASDGFWEHISDGAAVEMVYKSPRFVSSVFCMVYTTLVLASFLPIVQRKILF